MKIHITYRILLLVFLLQVGKLYAQDSNSLVLVDNQILSTDKQIIVINIWNSKYPSEFDKLNSLKKKYEKENIIFLSITDEEDNDVSVFLKNHPFHYEQIANAEREKIFNKFQTGMFKVFPMHIIIDQNGEVSFKKKNYIKNIDLKLARKIDQLLRNQPIDKFRYYDSQYVTNKNFNN
jgi:hypothetical protein